MEHNYHLKCPACGYMMTTMDCTDVVCPNCRADMTPDWGRLLKKHHVDCTEEELGAAALEARIEGRTDDAKIIEGWFKERMKA